MTAAQDLAIIVDLACLTEDRSRTEQRALLAVAKRVDKAINAQTGTNPHLPKNRGVMPPPCTYSDDHDKKTCACRGDQVAWEPVTGWSRRVHQVEATLAPWSDQ